MPTDITTEPERSGRVLRITLIVLAVIALLAVGGVQQYRVNTANDNTDVATSQRNAALADLTASEGHLKSAKGDLANAQDTLAACDLVVEMSDHQYEALNNSIEALTDLTDFDYVAATPKIEKATNWVTKVNAVMDDNGYDTYEDLWTACSPDHTTL